MKDVIMLLVLIIITLILGVLSLIVFPVDIVGVVKFIYKFIGPTSFLLVPMLIFTISLLIILTTQEKLSDNVLNLIAKCQFLSPLLGILGTLIGFMGGTLGFINGFNMKTVGTLIVNTGQGIGSTLVGIILFGILTLVAAETNEAKPQNNRDKKQEEIT
jgi:hypothetical protein